MQALEGGTWKAGTQSRVQQGTQVIDGQRLQMDPGHALLGKRPGQAEWKRPSRFSPREQKPDRFALQTTDREPQRGRGGRIEPLHVVERNQDGTRSCCLAERGQY